MLELTLTLTPAEGALIRLLGLIERRGFPLGAIHTTPSDSGLNVRLRLPADGRSGDVLLRHVQRLYDVRDARMDLISARSELTCTEPTTFRSATMPRDIHSSSVGGLSV